MTKRDLFKWALTALCLFTACRNQADAPSLVLPPPMIPPTEGALAPSHAQLTQPYSQTVHTEVDTCIQCHPQHGREWRESVHHLASFNNPFYRISFEDYVAEVGPQHANFCGGCHDPTLLATGELSKPIAPTNPRAHAGITCMSCHGIAKATTGGVGSYTLRTGPIHAPLDDTKESIELHRQQVTSKILYSDTLCVSCHKGFLSSASGHSVFLPALDEHRPWRESGWAGTSSKRMNKAAKVKGCRDCHMQERDGHHSHRFAGGHTDLAAAIGSQEQASALLEQIKGTLTLDIQFSSKRTTTTSYTLIDVIMVNQEVGHHFPGGARDLRDAWVEIELIGADNTVVASSGSDYRRDPNEKDVHRLRVGLVDPNGALLETHGVGHFRTPAFDHTIGPEDAAIARYKVPENISPLQVRARVLQRRLNPKFHAYACKSSRTKRGKEFSAATTKFTGQAVDPCAPQPIVTVAEAISPFPKADGPVEPQGSWPELYWYGIALTHDLQEHAQKAIAVFEQALRHQHTTAHSREDEAMVRAEYARALLRAGRTKQAEQELKRAHALYPDQPLIYALQAKSLRQTWRLQESIAPLAEAVSLAPQDAGLIRELALAYGSSGNHTSALSAAQRGLALEPRDVDLLRLQMLAYQNLIPGSTEHLQAKQAFLTHKRDENAPTIRSRCSQSSQQCRKEQLPIPLRHLKVRAPAP